MHIRNVPRIDAGYGAIVAASMCGTNAGDLAAGPLGLGQVETFRLWRFSEGWES